jgi:hypothetical protein
MHHAIRSSLYGCRQRQTSTPFRMAYGTVRVRTLVVRHGDSWVGLVRRCPLTTRVGLLALSFLALISTLLAGSSGPAVAFDPLPRSPSVGSLEIPLLSYHSVPISNLLSDPTTYHRREIRIAGTNHAIQTRVMSRGYGVPYALTIVSLDDESGLYGYHGQGSLRQKYTRGARAEACPRRSCRSVSPD